MDKIVRFWTLVECHRAEIRVKEKTEKPALTCGQPKEDGGTAGGKPQALAGGLDLLWLRVWPWLSFGPDPFWLKGSTTIAKGGVCVSFLAFFSQKPYSIILPSDFCH